MSDSALQNQQAPALSGGSVTSGVSPVAFAVDVAAREEVTRKHKNFIQEAFQSVSTLSCRMYQLNPAEQHAQNRIPNHHSLRTSYDNLLRSKLDLLEALSALEQSAPQQHQQQHYYDYGQPTTTQHSHPYHPPYPHQQYVQTPFDPRQTPAGQQPTPTTYPPPFGPPQTMEPIGNEKRRRRSSSRTPPRKEKPIEEKKDRVVWTAAQKEGVLAEKEALSKALKVGKNKISWFNNRFQLKGWPDVKPEDKKKVEEATKRVAALFQEETEGTTTNPVPVPEE